MMRRILSICTALVIIQGTALAQGLSPSPSISEKWQENHVDVAQVLLKHIGLLKRNPNGILDSETGQALREFAISRGKQPTHQLDQSILEELAIAAQAHMKRPEIILDDMSDVAVQKSIADAISALSQLQFFIKSRSHKFDTLASAALSSFERRQGLPVTGDLNELTLLNLRLASQADLIGTTKTLRMLNWPAYIDPDALLEFTRQTGTKIIYMHFQSTEELVALLKSGEHNADIVFPSAGIIGAVSNSLAKIDRSRLKNWNNIDSTIVAKISASYDPSAHHSVPYMWGQLGFGYNNKIPNDGHKYKSFGLLFDKQIIEKMSHCGVAIIDEPTEIIPAVLSYLGLSMSLSQPNLNAVEATLHDIRPFVRVMENDEFIDALSNNELCLAYGYAGDIIQASKRGTTHKIRFSPPKEGKFLWYDVMSITADAKNKNEAYEFIDFMLDPAVIGAVSNHIQYANANKASWQYIGDIGSNPDIIPTREVIQEAIEPSPRSDADLERLGALWERFKRGDAPVVSIAPAAARTNTAKPLPTIPAPTPTPAAIISIPRPIALPAPASTARMPFTPRESRCDISADDLSGRNLKRCILSGADLRHVNLAGSSLDGASLADADFSGANLSGASLGNANLTRARFNATNLTNANLQGAILRDAELTGAQLKGANLKRADLRAATLQSVVWTGAQVDKAILLSVQNLDCVSFKSALDGDAAELGDYCR